jgi:hypothetical protein
MKYDSNVDLYRLSREQTLFVCCWFNLTHACSLDSYRVPVMHAFNILEELLRLNNCAHASQEDRAMVGREAAQVLRAEAILKRGRFDAATRAVCSLLDAFYGEKQTRRNPESGRTLLDSCLREHIALLAHYYLTELLECLREALLNPDTRSEAERFAEISSMTGSLLSHLLARGQSLESLFQLYRQVLVPPRPPEKAYEFANRFDWLMRMIAAPITTWGAYFAIDGITDVDAFPERIGDIKFVSTLPHEAQIRKAMQRTKRRLFAYGETASVDGRTAGQLLHDRINRVLDLVRFEYDRSHITISDEFVVRQSAGEKWQLLPIPKVVPNPRAAISREELHEFANNVRRLVTGERFSTVDRDRVLSAFRLYRVGADNRNFENKLVNWWSGLEYLAKSGSGGAAIGAAVEASVIPVLMVVSIANQLCACREILLEHSIDLLDTPADAPFSLKQLELCELYEALAKPEHRSGVVKKLGGVPLAQMRLDSFMELLADPKKMHLFLAKAEQSLRWHLQRIYRARCDIVHSACRMVNVALLCANLEAYLKSTLTALLAGFQRMPTLASTQEFFIRIEHVYEMARESLAQGDATALKAMLSYARV